MTLLRIWDAYLYTRNSIIHFFLQLSLWSRVFWKQNLAAVKISGAFKCMMFPSLGLHPGEWTWNVKTTIKKKHHLPNIHFGFHVSFWRGGNSGKLLVQNFKHPTYNGPMAEPWEFPLLGVVYGTVKFMQNVLYVGWKKSVSSTCYV